MRVKTDRYRFGFFLVGLLMVWLTVFGVAVFLNGLDELLKALP